MTEFICTVPTDLVLDTEGNPHYIKCGEPAKYKVGDWYVCEGHKKYYTDAHNWPAEPLEGVINDNSNESGC